ncbi:MAG: metal-dependent hydrolase [Candidatus Nanoarchaeia archaeon]
MLIRTHLAITLLFVLLFFQSISNKILFIGIALVATFLPDIDSRNSKIGKLKIFRPLQFLFGHRGFIHSFTFLFLITLLFVFLIPIIVFPFFLGYGLHLLADSLTIQGIKPFYPFGGIYSSKIKTGGRVEIIIFVSLLFIEGLLVITYLLNML